VEGPHSQEEWRVSLALLCSALVFFFWLFCRKGFCSRNLHTSCRRPYQIWFEGLELLPGTSAGNPIVNSSANAVASSNVFEIEGGVALFPKEIAGIVVGSLAGVALLVGLFVVGARLVRKRKSVAVDLPGPEEGGYSDVREVGA
jgi:predicted permease